jgi:hypothetical protein
MIELITALAEIRHLINSRTTAEALQDLPATALDLQKIVAAAQAGIAAIDVRKPTGR